MRINDDDIFKLDNIPLFLFMNCIPYL